MSSENRLPFTVQETNGGWETYSTYGKQASQILTTAIPNIAEYKRGGAGRAITEDFDYSGSTVFLLFHQSDLVGFSSYSQMYVDPVKQSELEYFSWSEEQWKENQKLTASSGWTAIHPDFQHRGGWSKMMNAFDTSLVRSQHLYQVRNVRKAGNYADKVKERYHDNIVFQADTFYIDPQIYFRIRIPRE